MRYQISHLTRYTYQSDVTNCYNAGFLMPRAFPYQVVEASRVDVKPQASNLKMCDDFFGNRQLFFHIRSLHRQLEVKATSRVKVTSRSPWGDFYDSMPWDRLIPYLQHARDQSAMQARLLTHGTSMTPCDEVLAGFARQAFTPGTPILEGAQKLASLIFHEFTFDPGYTTLTTPVRTVFETRRGVCQDFAQLAVSAIRSLGLPARYVSGYLETLPPPGQERLVGADASHAWFGAFDPAVGWVDFDPTNNLIVDERHVTVSFGRDYADVAPLKGLTIGGGENTMTVAVDVMPIVEPVD